MTIKRISLIVLLAFTLLVFVAACTSTTPKRADQSGQGAKTGQEIEPPNGEAAEGLESGETFNQSTGTYESVNKSGQAGMPPSSTGTTLPKDWPAYIPIMPGLTVISSNVTAPAGAMIMIAALKGTVSLDEVQSFYQKIEGWKLDTVMKTVLNGDNRTFRMIHAPGEYLGVSIKVEKGTTLVSLMYNKSGRPEPARPTK